MSDPRASRKSRHLARVTFEALRKCQLARQYGYFCISDRSVGRRPNRRRYEKRANPLCRHFCLRPTFVSASPALGEHRVEPIELFRRAVVKLDPPDLAVASNPYLRPDRALQSL